MSPRITAALVITCAVACASKVAFRSSTLAAEGCAVRDINHGSSAEYHAERM